jgi:hypothetical protein
MFLRIPKLSKPRLTLVKLLDFEEKEEIHPASRQKPSEI